MSRAILWPDPAPPLCLQTDFDPAIHGGPCGCSAPHKHFAAVCPAGYRKRDALAFCPALQVPLRYIRGHCPQRIAFGFPRHSITRSSVRTTREAGREKSTSMVKPSTIEIINHVEGAKTAPITQLVSHKIHRPDLIRPKAQASASGFSLTSLLLWPDPHIQRQLPVDPIDPLVVPAKALDIAQI